MGAVVPLPVSAYLEIIIENMNICVQATPVYYCNQKQLFIEQL